MEYIDFGPIAKNLKFLVTYSQIIPNSGFKTCEKTETILAVDRESAERKLHIKICKKGQSFTLLSIKEIK